MILRVFCQSDRPTDTECAAFFGGKAFLVASKESHIGSADDTDDTHASGAVMLELMYEKSKSEN